MSENSTLLPTPVPFENPLDPEENPWAAVLFESYARVNASRVEEVREVEPTLEAPPVPEVPLAAPAASSAPVELTPVAPTTPVEPAPITVISTPEPSNATCSSFTAVPPTLLPYVPTQHMNTKFLYDFYELTPINLLSSNGTMATHISKDYTSFVINSISFFENYLENSPLSDNQVNFYHLAKAIERSDGNVLDFALDRNAPHAAWMRLRTSHFIRRILAFTLLPGLSVGFNKPTLPTHLEQYYYMDLDYISVEAIYRHFFLDKALTYYVELYAADLRGTSSSLSALEQHFLREFSYFDFIACITYLGSILLQAAQSFSRILYEGLRLMLIKAYCSLGIMQWTAPAMQEKFIKKETKHDYLFSKELLLSDRVPLVKNVGMAYAQYGWELLKQRPNGIHYLTAVTYTALFKAIKDMYPDYTVTLPHGYIPYTFTFGTKASPVTFLNKRSYLKDMEDFCETEDLESVEDIKGVGHMRFYKCPITDATNNLLTHEWFVLADILAIFPSDDLGKLYQIQDEKISALTTISPYDSSSIRNSLYFKHLSDFGFRRLPGNPKHYRFDLAQYLRQRFTTSLNRALFYDIPLAVYKELNTKDTSVPSELLENIRNNFLSTKETSDQLIEVKRELSERDSAVSSLAIRTKYQSLESRKVALEHHWNYVICPINTVLAEETAQYLKLANFSADLDFKAFVTGENNTVIEDVGEVQIPIQFWELSVSKDALVRFLKSLRPYKNGILYVQQVELSQVRGVRPMRDRIPGKTIFKLPKVPSDMITTRGQLQRGRRPSPILFTIPTVPVGFVTMLVTLRNDLLYVGFTGEIGKALTSSISSSPRLLRAIHVYRIYPYTFLSLDVLLESVACLDILRELLDFDYFMGIANQLKTYFTSKSLFTACTKQKSMPPSWIWDKRGATNVDMYLKLHTFIIDEEVKRVLRVAHNLDDTNIDKDIYSQVYFNEVAQKIQQNTLRTKAALTRIQGAGDEGSRYYAPNFTPEEDLHIKAYISPYMTDQDKNLLMAACPGRPWPALRTRARNLTQQLLTQDKVFDVDKLPINNYTGKIRKQLEANFEVALNVDPRLKVNEDKNTVEALKKRYLALEPRRR
jgi:hypothetical protein